MKKKIFCIAIVSMFVLVSVSVVSKPTNKIKENDEITEKLETSISNVKLKDCPCQNLQSNSDPHDLGWYPFKNIICGLLFLIGAPWALIRNLIDGGLPLVFLALGQAFGCWWAEWP